MLEKNDIKDVLIKDSKVNSILFYHKERNYVAEITSSKITIQEVGEYNIKTGKSSWNLKHCCGEYGFGSFPEDECLACENHGKTEDIFEAQGIYGNYTKKLEEILTKDIPRYCKSLEKIFKETPVNSKERSKEALEECKKEIIELFDSENKTYIPSELHSEMLGRGYHSHTIRNALSYMSGSGKLIIGPDLEISLGLK